LTWAARVELETIAAGLDVFHPEPHRIEEVAVIGAVTYIDDSKANNPAAAAASLAAFPKIERVAGGRCRALQDRVDGGRTVPRGRRRRGGADRRSPPAATGCGPARGRPWTFPGGSG